MVDVLKKIDLPMQILLLSICIIPITIHIFYSILWIISMPVLGCWQLVSVWIYAHHKQINEWHKTYLKTLLSVLIFVILEFIIAATSNFDSDILTIGSIIAVLLSFILAIFYMFVTYKTSKIPTEDRF